MERHFIIETLEANLFSLSKRKFRDDVSQLPTRYIKETASGKRWLLNLVAKVEKEPCLNAESRPLQLLALFWKESEPPTQFRKTMAKPRNLFSKAGLRKPEFKIPSHESEPFSPFSSSVLHSDV